MKKVLLMMDGDHFSEGAWAFACHLHKHAPILLSGFFIPELDFARLSSYSYATGGPLYVPNYPIAEEDTGVNRSIQRFEERCAASHMQYELHSDCGSYSLPAIIKQTRFSDLLIISSELFYKDYGKKQPNAYLRDILHETECPVVLVPENYSLPARCLLAFDGSAGAAYAIKQFSYLFPGWLNHDTELVYVHPALNGQVPDMPLIEEYLPLHYGSFTLLQLPDCTAFAGWASAQKNTLLVMGAYGRSFLSELWKKSFAAGIIREHHLPVFIAH